MPVARDGTLPAVGEAVVQRWAARYQQDYRPAFEKALVAAQPWAGLIAAKLEAAGLPGALVYLPVIESGYQTRAVSSAGAVGLWQFMPGTARGYGLTINGWLDERRDPLKATDAAVRYLRDLYREQGGDWYRALAGYNAGGGRVTRALRVTGGYGAHAFWTAMPALPRETRNYVPQLLAVARLGADPARYGIRVPAPAPAPAIVRVPLPPATRLDVVARVWGISLDWIAEYNPALRVAATPPDRTYPLILPADGAVAKRDALFALPVEARQLPAGAIRRGGR